MSQIDHTSLFDLALVNLLMFWGHDQMLPFGSYDFV